MSCANGTQRETVAGHRQTPEWRHRAAERLDQLLALPMLALTLVFIVVFALPVLFPSLSPGTRAMLNDVDLGIWAVFLAEYLARFYVAPRRLAFVWHNAFDLLLVVIPVLRPLRLLRSVRLIRAARVATIGAGASRVVQRSRMHLASRVMLLATGSTVILILTTAVMGLDFEQAAPRANITTFSDALWWAVSTTATVGYGDHYPVTAAGRATGIVLMIAGVGIFGVVAASAAAWFVSEGQSQDSNQRAESIAALTAEIAALRQTVDELRERLGAVPAPPAAPKPLPHESAFPRKRLVKDRTRATWKLTRRLPPLWVSAPTGSPGRAPLPPPPRSRGRGRRQDLPR
jgi:voltage-gated potassium channel